MAKPRTTRHTPLYRGVSDREYFETIINLRFEALDSSIAEARRIMEARMQGFPSEFAQKSDMALTAASLADLKRMFENTIPRSEYDNKHQTLQEKIDACNKDITELKTDRANIQGRVLATGGAAIVIIAIVQVVIQVIFHVYAVK